MPKAKFDGVIEAVRYTPDGRIALVRAYERRGATFSDHVLIDRQALIERLKKGKRFVVGQRKAYWASTFEIGKPVGYHTRDGKGVITTDGQASEKDFLAGVPIF